MKTQTQSSLKAMFKLAMLALLMVFFSCSQETVLDSELDGTENLNAETAKGKKAKKGKKARPLKATLFNFADPNQQAEDVLLCIPEEAGFPLTRNVIGGNMSHLGKLQQGSKFDEIAMEPISGSFGVPISCFINLDTFAQLNTEFNVYYVAANGDQFVLYEKVTIDFPNTYVDDEDETQIDYTTGTFTNTLGEDGLPIPAVIVSGTGRFEGATAEIFIVNGVFGPEGATWELVGTITY